MKSVFVSILNFNGRKNTLDCLESLKKINIDDFKLTIIVVDNNSAERLNLRDESFGKIELKIIANEVNLGFSGGQNVGIKYALENGADYVLILNNDTYVDENFLKELIEAVEADKSIGITVPKIYFATGFEFHKERYSGKEKGKVMWYAGGEMDWKNIIGHNHGVDDVDEGQFDKLGETEVATGCCMLVKREVFEKIGYFDERYFLYYEDADLTMRVKDMGSKIFYVPKAKIWHKNAGSTGGSGSDIQDYYISRNRLLFGFQYASIRSKLALFRESLSLIFGGRKWQRRGVMDYYLGRLNKGSFDL